MKTNSELQVLVLTPEQQKTRRQRNVAIGIASSCFVLLFWQWKGYWQPKK
jgi:hypothetical protein